MQDYISVRVISLGELFSGTFRFRLPYFQRAYAWHTTEVSRLLANVLEAMSEPEDLRRYFLGKLMLAKDPGEPDTALVDGHQRIMSLTILFAVLRDLENAPDARGRLHGFIAGSGYRLAPQEANAEFCERYVQALGATGVDLEEDIAELSETERNIIENRNLLRFELTKPEISDADRRGLIEFLSDRCFVIVSSVSDENEAWRILKTEEETRVGFSETDRAKASLLSIIPPEERSACQRVWEACESQLGATDMHGLLGHMRTLKLRKRSERPIEIDIAEGFRFDRPRSGRAFLEQELLPAANLLAKIRHGGLDGATEAGASQDVIQRLDWINTQLWVPAALLWLTRRSGDRETALFFRRIERLVWLMRIAGHDPTKQQRRILSLLSEIERGLPVDSMKELDISKTIREPALANLRSKTFDSKHYDARVLRRVSIALGQDPGPIHADSLTIEHILPRGFSPKSGWRTHFPTKKAVQSYCHMLGNLTFLTSADNRAADTLDWPEKRAILARSRLVLSNRLAATVEWTPAAIVSRTEELIRILFQAWDLKL